MTSGILACGKSQCELFENHSEAMGSIEERHKQVLELLNVEETAVLILVSMYTLVFIVGFIGNILIIFAICKNARSLPVRNNLLINLCVSDLMVTVVCVPVSVCTNIYKAWFLGNPMCKTAYYLQSLPVAASTLSLMMLSLDRYAAIKHPRIFSRLRQRHLATKMITTVWTGASLISAPILYVRTTQKETMGSIAVTFCVEMWSSPTLKVSYSICYLFVVFVIPCLTVAICHASVGYKLCSTNLVAAEERRKQMKPKQVIIIAKDNVTEGRPTKKVIPYENHENDSSEDDDGFVNMQIQEDLENLRRAAARVKVNRHKQLTSLSGVRRKPLKAAKTERSIIKANRKLRQGKHLRTKPTLIKTYSNQSFRSRRRLANMLVVLVVVFVACWVPYIVCSLIDDLMPNPAVTYILPFCLFFGHAHSAINPVVYWFLNRNFLQKVQKALRLHTCFPNYHPQRTTKSRFGHCLKLGQFRIPVIRRNSSTNEAALGPFHPKYVTHRNYLGRPSKCTSHFLQ